MFPEFGSSNTYGYTAGVKVNVAEGARTRSGNGMTGAFIGEMCRVPEMVPPGKAAEPGPEQTSEGQYVWLQAHAQRS